MILSLRGKFFFTKKIEGQKNQNLHILSCQEWFELSQASWKFYFITYFSLKKLICIKKPWFFIGFFKICTETPKKISKNWDIQIQKMFPWKTSLELTPHQAVWSQPLQKLFFLDLKMEQISPFSWFFEIFENLVEFQTLVKQS